MKYTEGQEFILNQDMDFSEENYFKQRYRPLKAGETFKIVAVGNKHMNPPYLVAFPNGYGVGMTEERIEELSN